MASEASTLGKHTCLQIVGCQFVLWTQFSEGSILACLAPSCCKDRNVNIQAVSMLELQLEVHFLYFPPFLLPLSPFYRWDRSNTDSLAHNCYIKLPGTSKLHYHSLVWLPTAFWLTSILVPFCPLFLREFYKGMCYCHHSSMWNLQ